MLTCPASLRQTLGTGRELVEAVGPFSGAAQAKTRRRSLKGGDSWRARVRKSECTPDPTLRIHAWS